MPLKFLVVLMICVLSALAGADVKQLNRQNYGGTDEQWAAHSQLLDQPAPELKLTEWINGDPTDGKGLKGLEGKIVLLDFWATWCGPCIAHIPDANELAQTYADKGVVVIGLCGGGGEQKMAAVANEYGMAYPSARISPDSVKTWNVTFWPTYVLVDRKGNVRAFGLRPEGIVPTLEELLKEQPAE